MKNRLFRIFTELARHHISIMLAITLFDLVLIALGESVTVCFSLLLPQRILEFGEAYAIMADVMYTAVPGIRLYTYLMITICFALFGICLGCSYRRPGWLICAASMTFMDIAVAVWMIIATDDPTYFVDIGVHAWIVLALVLGYVFEKLRTAPPKVVEQSAEETAEVQAVTEAEEIAEVEEIIEAEEVAEVEELPVPDELPAPEADQAPAETVTEQQ